MTLVNLWIKRSRPRLATKRWLVVWVKRALLMPKLLAMIARTHLYRFRGAKIGSMTYLGKIRVEGPLTNLTVDSHCVIGDRVHFALHGPVFICERAIVNEGVRFLTATHRTDSPFWETKRKPIFIGRYAWIAIGATILPGVRVGEGSVVGASALVSKNVDDYAIVAGNPATPVGSRCTELRYEPDEFPAPFEAWLK